MRIAARSRGRGLCTLVLCVHAALVQSFALGTVRTVGGLRNVLHPVCGRQPVVRLSVLGGADSGVEQPEANGWDEPLGASPPTQMQQAPPDISKGQFGGGSGGTAVLEDTDFSVNTILKQLESIQQGTPKNIVILGTRHCSFLHQQIIELLSYALVLSDNHIFTSGATGTHAAAIRGALRAENPELLTVILPQTIRRQPREIRDLLGQVQKVIELAHDALPLDAASRLCNSELLSKGDQLIVFAFHDSKTLRETIEEAKAMSLLTTVLFLD